MGLMLICMKIQLSYRRKEKKERSVTDTDVNTAVPKLRKEKGGSLLASQS
jgi:hypothetical protein